VVLFHGGGRFGFGLLAWRRELRERDGEMESHGHGGLVLRKCVMGALSWGDVGWVMRWSARSWNHGEGDERTRDCHELLVCGAMVVVAMR
jgi:hypothetical protein